MAIVFKGRYTAQIDEPFVAFFNGMWINKLWAFSRWIPVLAATRPVLRTLYAYPEKGFLGAEGFP